jgi:diguanylate cyclase (GGDEF)-like protein
MTISPATRTRARQPGPNLAPWWFLSAYSVAVAGFFLMPLGIAFWVYNDVVVGLAVVAMAWGIRRHRPPRAGSLWVVVAGQALVIAGLLALTLAPDQPFPRPADALFLSAYAVQIAGWVALVRQRLRGQGRESLLDAGVISCGFVLLSWVFMIKPAVSGGYGSVTASLVSLGYPLVDLFNLVLVIRLLAGNALHNRSIRLLVGAQLLSLAGDCGMAVFVRFGDPTGSLPIHLVATTSALVAGLYGAALLHPSTAEVTLPTPTGSGRDNPRLRTALLCAAVLIGPGLLGIEAWRNHSEVADAAAIALGCVAIFVLVVTRMQVLVTTVRSQSAALSEQAVQLEILAQRDSLTGLANRRAWDVALHNGLNHAARDAVPVTVALIDLDHFKQYNDTHGHQAGDRLLKDAAAAWSATLRQVDVLARYGGEEFIALLPGCDAATVQIVLDRLRAASPDALTFSAGIATWDTDESAERLVGRADQALYAAKKAGRDRSIVAAAVAANQSH